MISAKVWPGMEWPDWDIQTWHHLSRDGCIDAPNLIPAGSMWADPAIPEIRFPARPRITYAWREAPQMKMTSDGWPVGFRL